MYEGLSTIVTTDHLTVSRQQSPINSVVTGDSYQHCQYVHRLPEITVLGKYKHRGFLQDSYIASKALSIRSEKNFTLAHIGSKVFKKNYVTLCLFKRSRITGALIQIAAQEPHCSLILFLQHSWNTTTLKQLNQGSSHFDILFTPYKLLDWGSIPPLNPPFFFFLGGRPPLGVAAFQ